MNIRILLIYIITTGILSACRVDVEPPGIEEENYPVDLEVPAPPVNFGIVNIPEDNPQTRYGQHLGRLLFYDTKLSGDNTMSCATCHKQEFGFADNSATSAGIDGVFGNRSTMALANLAWDEKFFWDGRSSSLEHQALQPIQNPIELHTTLEAVIAKLKSDEDYPDLFEKAFGSPGITAERIGKAIAQFERTLISSNSRFDRYLRGELELTDQEKRGLELMQHPVPGVVRGGNCSDCHTGYTFTNKVFKNNGLDVTVGEDKGLESITGNVSDRGKFKVPSLRNIALTAPYMHDGRFETLEEVLDHYNDTSLFAHENVDIQILGGINEPEGKSLQITEQEKKDIIAFLKALTDTNFVTNPAFSDPFN